jgi:tetratricopeptide (TPR) repeat protein
LHLTLAKAAQQLGEAVKAAFHYKKASELDAGVLPELSSWANVLWEKKEWRGAAALYDVLHDRADVAESPADKLEMTYRLGRARLELCERRLATEVLQKALQLDARHRPTQEAMARVSHRARGPPGRGRGEDRARDLVDTADERYTLLCEIGAILRDRLRDREGALEAFRRRSNAARTTIASFTPCSSCTRRKAVVGCGLGHQAPCGHLTRTPSFRPATWWPPETSSTSSSQTARRRARPYEEALDLDPDDLKTWRHVERGLQGAKRLASSGACQTCE